MLKKYFSFYSFNNSGLLWAGPRYHYDGAVFPLSELSFAVKTCALLGTVLSPAQPAFLQYSLAVAASENQFIMNGSKLNYIAEGSNAFRFAVDTAVQLVQIFLWPLAYFY